MNINSYFLFLFVYCRFILYISVLIKVTQSDSKIMNSKIHLPFSIDSFPKKLLTLVPSIEICKLFKENNLFQTEETKTIFGWFKTHPVGNPEVINFVSLYGKIEYEYAYPAPTLQELLDSIIHSINYEVKNGFDILNN